MKEKTNNLAKFSPDRYYHVFNRSNNRENLFLTDGDRSFFMEKYEQYLLDYVDTYSWCLMDNHFHFNVKIKSGQEILNTLDRLPQENLLSAQKKFLQAIENQRDYHSLIERQFTRLFTSYAMRFNKQNKRCGNLFYRPFKRVEVLNMDHLKWLIFYIHSNPMKHGVLKDFTRYKWSSYPSYLKDTSELICKKEVFNWYGGEYEFQKYHSEGILMMQETTYLELEE